MKNDAVLSCQCLTAAYGRRAVLREVTLKFPRGTLTAVLGTNGCGKSTLLKTLAGGIRPVSGAVFLGERPLRGMTAQERARQLTILPQHRPVPELTVSETVLAGRFPYLRFPRRYGKTDRLAAEAALEAVHAADLRDRAVRELSGGERQRVYLAAALAQDTEILLLDEPCTGLDAGTALALLERLKMLTKTGKTVVMSHHDLPSALSHADIAVVMEQGRVAAEGIPQTVLPAVERVFGVELVTMGETYGIRRRV